MQDNAKNILITGKNSYVGESVRDHLISHGYTVTELDMISPEWRNHDFSVYDAVFHVAGIAHSDTGKADDETKARYYAVNTNLTVETAKKAKAAGVKQFVFMSSAIVYGESGKIGKSKLIAAETPPAPANFYGDSKLQAENGILPLADESFTVTVLRPPMIYGKNSKGNFVTLEKLANKMPLFPYVKNERSMLFVGNLAEFVRLVIKNNDGGVFFPQNAEYTNTSEMVKMIAAAKGKRIRLVRGFGWALKILSPFTGLVNKAFGNLSYDQALSEYPENYRLYSLAQSVELSCKEEIE